MKIHRVVQMLGATTSTGKLADDMYDLGHKDYYSEAQDRYIPISHMDFQHMVRAFVKQIEEDIKNRHDNHMKILYGDTRKANDIVSKEAYQVMWDNCEKLKEDVKKTDDIVERNDRIYKKNLAELQQKYDDLKTKSEYDGLNVEGVRTVWQERYEKEVDKAEYWKAQYRIANDLLQPKGCGYVFSEIPNDTDGQEFVDTMKKYFNKKSYKMRVRGQHVKPELRGTGVTSHGQNIDESTHLRVYIDVK